MASDGESTGKSKGQTGQRDEADIDEHNQLETIPTMVPREGDATHCCAVDLSDKGLDVSENWAAP